MRIVSLNIENGSTDICDTEVLLRPLASSPDRLAAAAWQKLLALVQALASRGDHPEVHCIVLGDELTLCPRNVDGAVSIGIRMDWRDYAPLVDGLPEMHYRLQVKREGEVLSEDIRAANIEEAEKIVLRECNFPYQDDA